MLEIDIALTVSPGAI